MRINVGLYPPGSASEPELSGEDGVSRVTINRAIGLLRASGIVRVRRGAGTYVRALPTIVRDARSRYSARGRGAGAAQVEIADLGLNSRTEYREIGTVGAPARVAAALAVAEGDDVLVRRRVLYADEEPTQIADSYFPWLLVASNPPIRSSSVRADRTTGSAEHGSGRDPVYRGRTRQDAHRRRADGAAPGEVNPCVTSCTSRPRRTARPSRRPSTC